MNLLGRSAVITGANQGLGRVIAEHFVRAGANVLLMARGEEKLNETAVELAAINEQRVKILTAVGDVSQADDCNKAIEKARTELPNLCILVNNAGIYGPMGGVEEIAWDEWVSAIEINLFGTVLMCRAIVPLFKSQHYGKIINLSGGGATAPLPRISAYAASKAAVVRFTETLALELQSDRVDVNSIAPGALNTRLLDEVLAAGPDKVGREFYDRSLKQSKEGGASLDKGAALSTFLASAESDGITGRLFSAVWDDWANMTQRREALAKSDIYTLRRIVPEDRGQKWKCA